MGGQAPCQLLGSVPISAGRQLRKLSIPFSEIEEGQRHCVFLFLPCFLLFALAECEKSDVAKRVFQSFPGVHHMVELPYMLVLQLSAQSWKHKYVTVPSTVASPPLWLNTVEVTQKSELWTNTVMAIRKLGVVRGYWFLNKYSSTCTAFSRMTGGLDPPSQGKIKATFYSAVGSNTHYVYNISWWYFMF